MAREHSKKIVMTAGLCVWTTPLWIHLHTQWEHTGYISVNSSFCSCPNTQHKWKWTKGENKTWVQVKKD